MAKRKAQSIHSRAARRATSPSIDTDKSLKDIQPPSRASRAAAGKARPSVLAVHQSAGVSKKAKNGRKSQLSAKARRRQEKGLEMAEAVIERTKNKVEKSFGRAGLVRSRSRAWEDINKAAGATEGDDSEEERPAKRKGALAEDQDMDVGQEEDGKPVEDAVGEQNLPPLPDSDDEIL